MESRAGNRRFARICWLVLMLCFWSAAGVATDYYIDPEGGSPAGDGSKARPWRTLQEVIEAGWLGRGEATVASDSGGVDARLVESGDTLFLLSGYHGECVLDGARHASGVRVAAADGHAPRLSRIRLQSLQDWSFEGLRISLSFADKPRKRAMVEILNGETEAPSAHIKIVDCEIFSVQDALPWTAEDWRNRAGNAITVQGRDCLIENNRIRNVAFGVTVTGERATIRGNRIEDFAGDAMRGLGDFGVFEYNHVEGALKIDRNHDDGFQSWSVGPGGVGTGEVKGIVLRGNVFKTRYDPKQPLYTHFQGIGCFDGFFVDWVIENNLVVVNHYHGITLMGARNCRIVNNTVIDIFDGRPGPSWIRIAPAKGGIQGENNLIRNNLANSISAQCKGTRADHNLEVARPASVFVNPKEMDFRLRRRSKAVGSGAAEYAPATDITGASRPPNTPVDLGAYAFSEIAPQGSRD